MRTFDVTLTELVCDFADGGAVEIAGTLFAKMFKRDRGLMQAETLFSAPTPVRLMTGQTHPVGTEATLTIRSSTDEPLDVLGELFGLGGNLGIGGDRYVLQLVVFDGATDVRFVSDDSRFIVRARHQIHLHPGL